MAKFKLLAGQHIQPDTTQPAVESTDTKGVVTKRYPPRTYTAPCTVENENDLVARFGTDKFQLIEGEPTVRSRPANEPSKAPGGQVSSGFQGREDGDAEIPKADDDKATAARPHAKHTHADIQHKTYPELVEIARKEKIDLKGASKKEDVIKAILAAHGS